MSKIDEVKCDFCEKRLPASEVVDRYWMTIRGIDLCSWECVGNYAARVILQQHEFRFAAAK
jgi:hypothetical protein